MRKPEDPEPAPDVPLWLLTYSDCITLLMTFFILLLTFATSEPERFEQMQLAAFGRAGSFGMVRDRKEPIEKESILVRQRPRSSRLTARGAELPPIHSDPGFESLSGGLRGLEQQDPQTLEKRHGLDAPLALLFTTQGQLTDAGRKLLALIAPQLKKLPLELVIQVAEPQELELAVSAAAYLTEIERVPPAKVAVAVGRRATGPERRARLIVTSTVSDRL